MKLWEPKDDSVDTDALRTPMSQQLGKLGMWHRSVASLPLVVTSAAEPIEHSVPRSAHYRGDAIDIRIWHLPDVPAAVEELKELLGPDYVVLQEPTHIHIHWSPVFHGTVG